MPSRPAARDGAPGLGIPSVPPHNAEAEQAVLGSCMYDPGVVDEVRAVLDGSDFYRPHHETIWHALLTLRAADAPTDPIALGEHLAGTGDLNRVGGPSYLHQLVSGMHAGGSAAYYAGIVREKAGLRRLQQTGVRTIQRAQEPGADPDEIRAAVETELRDEREKALASGQGRLSRYIVDGWKFVTETGADTEPLWGTREQTVWSSGESLMIVGPPGVGKTTLAHQVVLARLGLHDTVLDMPVSPSKRVLYLAMDRPKQIAKAMARRVTPDHQAALRDRLAVWQGPLPTTLDKEPDLLADLAAAHQADTIVIDSLKDAVSTMVDDSLAVAFHNARMRALRNGVEVMELHHQRKATADAPRGQRPTLDRVYGSTWITSGAGSVLFIAGEAGDPAVTLHHLKTPTGEIGPLQLIHDHTRGTTRIDPALDPSQLLAAHPGGMTTRDLATLLSGEATPTRGAVEKARRALDRLVAKGKATKREGTAGGSGGGQQARYYSALRHISAVS
ncbi:DnaB-like helicase N-terminal domain-containing protein [Streptomyces sp. DSM 40473]|uniref:DnaB-like helicase N-terminal domain-containing protein n=1 Tax=Streptomyces hesseae TaxID=3075519 RepID=A0ABU2SZT4_9ACTN|nr:DnaB-like helicase N-terminal domain-containing protein [Streptomyces sp. DSM 40473]MDT0453419.1 DnaB-like helicase N-terminal domain-containing protein [Streptomyces sp. DSM 40473]